MGESTRAIDRLPTGIPGFDLVVEGGFPRGRTVLCAGTSGSAKTVFAAHFLAAGIQGPGEPGVFVALEDAPGQIRVNMQGFGWDVPAWEAGGLWGFVDVSMDRDSDDVEVGRYDFRGLVARVEHEVRRIGAGRVAVDGLATLFERFENRHVVRVELRRLAAALRGLGVTSIITAERDSEFGEVARHGVEDFVADNVVVLRNALDGENRRRTVEVLKLRGASHRKGQFPFAVLSGAGIVVLPPGMTGAEPDAPGSARRITSGTADLDGMCGGGIFDDAIMLVSGPTGTGKTLLACHFAAPRDGGDASSSLFVSLEEGRDELVRNARHWGMDFEELERSGRLHILSRYPESSSIEELLAAIQELVERHRPGRVVLDSLSALERFSTAKSLQDFVTSLTLFLKHQGIASVFTTATTSLAGVDSVSETGLSTLTDAIVLLRYVELYGELRRGIMVLKVRGSNHDKQIREFTVDDTGLHIGKAFRNAVGILSGHPSQVTPSELERLSSMFGEDSQAG